MQKFEVQGEYTHVGVGGCFNGLFRTYEDNRIVGVMEDKGQDIIYNLGKTKLVFGLMSDSELNFWKLSPNIITAPVVYVMRKNRDYKYEGKWGRMDIPIGALARGVDGNKGLIELQEAFRSADLETTLDILARIDKDRIMPYLCPELVRNIEQYSVEKCGITLKPIFSITK